MGMPRRLLGADEYVVVRTRTHAKALIGPALLLILLCALVGAGLAAIPSSVRSWATYLVLLAGAFLVVVGCLRPFLRWWSSTYTLTNRRLVTRTGILTTVGHDLPLTRVNDVGVERSLSDRMFGCGTLRVHTASDDGEVVLPDVPAVEQLHVALSELIFGDVTRSGSGR